MHMVVMVEASPASSFEVAEPHFLLELLVVALNAPAHHGDVDEGVEGNVHRQRREPVFRQRRLALGPFDQSGSPPMPATYSRCCGSFR